MMDLALIAMPPEVAARPRDKRGLPILFTSEIEDDGTPNFRVSDGRKVAECAKKQLCGVCGQKLGYWIAFIGGPMGCENRCFADPPMHRACAEYALNVCPYLATKADRSLALQAKHGDEFAANDPTLIVEKPSKVGLYMTRGFRLIPNGNGFLFHAEPPKEIVWHEMGECGGARSGREAPAEDRSRETFMGVKHERGGE